MKIEIKKEADRIMAQMHSLYDDAKATEAGNGLTYEDFRIVFLITKIAELKKGIEKLKEEMEVTYERNN